MTDSSTGEAGGLPTGFPFSLAREAGGVCFISGMPALGPDGRYLPGTIEQELELAWGNVAAIARSSGYGVEEIAYVQCVLADIGDYSALNQWWHAEFPDPAAAPARFSFQAGALPFGCKVELQATAMHA